MTNANELMAQIHKNAVEHGFWDDVNIDRAVMLIVSEICEAMEADRNNLHAQMNPENISIMEALSDDAFCLFFSFHVKDTFEDEIADIAIRILDLMAFRNTAYMDGFKPNGMADLYNDLRGLTQFVSSKQYLWAIWSVECLAKNMGVDLEKHIALKMRYNRSRPYKHGKRY